MKRTFWFYLSILFVCALITNCAAQTVAIQNLSQNIVYGGFTNRLRIAAEGVCMCEARVTTDNGRIEKEASCNDYVITPMHSGRATVKVEERKHGRWMLMDSVIYRVRPIEATVFFQGKTGGTITKNEL